MNQYTKKIGFTGTIFLKEYSKIKEHKNKIRMINEETVAEQFKKGKAEVTVLNEESGNQITLDINSDPEDIKKYLGKKFM